MASEGPPGPAAPMGLNLRRRNNMSLQQSKNLAEDLKASLDIELALNVAKTKKSENAEQSIAGQDEASKILPQVHHI